MLLQESARKAVDGCLEALCFTRAADQGVVCCCFLLAAAQVSGLVEWVHSSSPRHPLAPASAALPWPLLWAACADGWVLLAPLLECLSKSQRAELCILHKNSPALCFGVFGANEDGICMFLMWSCCKHTLPLRVDKTHLFGTGFHQVFRS